MKGSCLCGAVQYCIASAPAAVELNHCYCMQCQKQHGAAMASYFVVRRDDVIFNDRSSLKAYSSSPQVTRSFCSTCGANISWQSAEYREWITITVASLDSPFSISGHQHFFEDSKPSWY